MVAASAGNILTWIVWVGAAFACLGSGIAVVTFSNPFYSALALIGNLGSLAVLYLLLSSEFVAAAQVLVYAGAVMVMFLFVIAYIGPRTESPWAGGPSWQAVGAVLAAAAPLLEIMLNGSNLALISFARHLDNGDGQIFALAVMAVAASEVVVGLGLIVALNRKRVPLDVDRLSSLRG